MSRVYQKHLTTSHDISNTGLAWLGLAWLGLAWLAHPYVHLIFGKLKNIRYLVSEYTIGGKSMAYFDTFFVAMNHKRLNVAASTGYDMERGGWL